LNAHLDDVPQTTPIEIWFQDEARIGQKNGVVRQWARKGTRPRQPADQRYENAYLFGAICPALGKGAAIASPWANTEAMQFHLDEISRRVAPGAQAVLIMDRAGWHTTSALAVPKNITATLLPSYLPELNPVENLVISPRQLALEQRVRKLRRYHRRGVRSLEQAGRATRPDQINWHARMGTCGSRRIAVGIRQPAAVELTATGGLEINIDC
jgi:hypothetical protein